MRRDCRQDANQPEIVSGLQALGFYVIDCSAVGQLIPGYPDLIAVRRGIVYLVEVKSEDGTLTGEQVILHAQLAAFGVIVHIVRNFDDVLKIAGARRAA
jgi:Holliday junction resolvase